VISNDMPSLMQIAVLRCVLEPVLETVLAPRVDGEENTAGQIMASKVVSRMIEQRLRIVV
jgi:hypothetical protein